jgi:hypothetical protein
MESQKITLPAPPKIEQKPKGEDKRRFAVVPLLALKDARLTPAAKAVLAMVCGYCNRAGVTHVSQKRIAQDMHTSQAAISRCMKSLKKCGYIEQLGTHYPMSRGATIRVVFDPSVSLQDAIGVASREGEDLRPDSMKINDDHLVRELMAKETFTEQELRDNRERLAQLLLHAFKTPNDKPRLYTPAKGDTIAVKKAKQAIRSRMAELRKQQYAEQASEQGNELSNEYRNNKRLCLYTKSVSGNVDIYQDDQNSIETAQRLGFDELVVYFESELFNGVKSESDLHVCSLLANRFTRSELQRYVTAHSGETVTQIGNRMLGTGC